MPVNRISPGALNKIIEGQLRAKTTCIIKFYSNGCHLCHNLKEYYEGVADDYPEVHFFAFNVGDDPSVEKRLKFSGVPSIVMIKTGTSTPKIRSLADPEDPNKETWFRVSDIKNFIEKEK